MDQVGDLVLVPHHRAQKGQGQGHRPAAIVLVEHQGMGNAPASGHPSQCLDSIVITYDSVQTHLSL